MRRCAEIMVSVPQDPCGRETALLELHDKLAALESHAFAEMDARGGWEAAHARRSLAGASDRI